MTGIGEVRQGDVDNVQRVLDVVLQEDRPYRVSLHSGEQVMVVPDHFWNSIVREHKEARDIIAEVERNSLNLFMRCYNMSRDLQTPPADRRA